MRFALLVLVVFPMLLGTACDNDESIQARNDQGNIDVNNNSIMDTIVIKVGSKEFTATLSNNSTATAFKTMLPLTIDMTELNGNEKYFRLPSNLPTNATNPGTIHSGDLMLWGANTLVLFYKTFSTSYGYTRIGKIDNPSGLASAFGAGNVTVVFQLQD